MPVFGQKHVKHVIAILLCLYFGVANVVERPVNLLMVGGFCRFCNLTAHHGNVTDSNACVL